jgi:hypothetical protein
MTEAEVSELDLSPFADKTYTPTLHDVFKVLGKKIVGEEESRMALFTNWILARKYCLLTGASRSGKTFIKDAVKDLIIGDVANGGLCYTMKQGSTKSGWYAAEEIAKASFVDIPELNQLPLDMTEVLKTWGENKTAQYSVVETIMGRKQNRKHILPYKPFVFAIADENNMSVPAELRYRLIEIRTDSSQDQTAKIIRAQAEKELNPFGHKKEIEVSIDENLKTHIKTLPPFEQLHYVNPLASFVADKVPKSFTDARTAHPVFQDSIKGLQRFYWKQSLIKTVDDYRVLFISPQVVMENYLVNGRIFLNSVMKCNDIELEILDALKTEQTWLHRKQIAKILRSKSINIRDSIIAKHLQNLEEMNYVDVRATGQTKHYGINDEANMSGFHIKGAELIEHCRVVMEQLHPAHYEEFCEAYLDRPTFIHPFTGKVIDLRTYELGTTPKKISKTNILENQPETVTNEEEGISAEVVMEEIPDDVELYNDWLNSGKRIYEYQFNDRYGNAKLTKALQEGEVFKPTPDTVQPLT